MTVTGMKDAYSTTAFTLFAKLVRPTDGQSVS